MQSLEQSDFSSRVEYVFWKTLFLIKGGFKTLAAFPAKWQLRHWILFCAFTASMAAAFIFKLPIQKFFSGGDGGIVGALADAGRYLGDYETPLLIGLAFAALGCAYTKEKWMDAGATILAAGAICGIITILLQFVLAEDRPHDGGRMFFFKLDGHGVSGHASSSSLFIFPILMILLKDSSKTARIVWAILLACWALLVAWSRMRYDMHFLWNVMSGLAVGLASGYAASSASLLADSKRK